jgi:hypothetical protein
VTSAAVDLVTHRRGRDMPSISDACNLIEGWFDRLAVVPPLREKLGLSFGAILDAVLDGDEGAIAAWRRVEREMRAPIRAREAGEPIYQPLIDRVAVVDALAHQFRATLQ